MRIFILLTITGLFFYSCNTNPPTSPESYPVGKIVATTTINFNQSPITPTKIVLLEDFANVSCYPCVTSNQIIESLLHGSYERKIAVVKFPTNFPSQSDPFFLANADVCNMRMDYYHVFFAPTIIVDGTLRPTATDSDEVKENIDASLIKPAKFSIIVNKSFQDSSLIVNTDVQTIGLAGINLNALVLYTVIVENNIEYDASNGEKVFYNVLRKVLPSDEGFSFAGKSTLQQPFTINWEADLQSNWNPDNLHVVAFIQNIQTKEILQTGADY
ncbi:MAG TPA: Omp28-related outer membrane protein [Ignavibacteriaceae bacterium]|nr:Omp28-related outer membrane protein [Ignavibacteriaceae bacterium]